MQSAKIELYGLEKDLKVPLIAEVGDVIIKNVSAPNPDKITIFHSLGKIGVISECLFVTLLSLYMKLSTGMAAEDAAVGQLIYDKHMEQIVE